MPREFKKPLTPPPPLPRPSTALPAQTTATAKLNPLLSSQIAHMQKQEEVKSHQHTDHHSTPLTVKPPMFNGKVSPIDRQGPTTRINTQILVPIDENASIDDQSQAKRRKTDEHAPDFNAAKPEVCLSTIDDIDEDDLTF
jgi:hypothetical protein